MRSSRGLLTVVLACLTILYVLFNSRANVELTNANETTNVEEPPVTSRQNYRYVTPSLAELGSRGSLPRMNKDVLMVTRVPDAGAELLVLILQRLQGYNAFKHIRLPPGDHGLLSTLQQELLVEEITSIIRQEAIPLTFDGDVRFLNFSGFGRQAPTFISIVRDPMDSRNVQRYRDGDDRSIRRAIPHFCGQDERCTVRNSEWALRRAKRNVHQWYPVVGVLELMEDSLRILENRFPYFFNKAVQIYKELRPRDYTSDSAVVLKPREKATLREYLADEIEFYEWLKSRLREETADR